MGQVLFNIQVCSVLLPVCLNTPAKQVTTVGAKWGAPAEISRHMQSNFLRISCAILMGFRDPEILEKKDLIEELGVKKSARKISNNFMDVCE